MPATASARRARSKTAKPLTPTPSYCGKRRVHDATAHMPPRAQTLKKESRGSRTDVSFSAALGAMRSPLRQLDSAGASSRKRGRVVHVALTDSPTAAMNCATTPRGIPIGRSATLSWLMIGVTE